MKKNTNMLCGVCGKEVTTDKNLFVSHQDQHGRLCYGSFMPAMSINPFQVRNINFEFGDEADEIVGGNPAVVGGAIASGALEAYANEIAPENGG